MKFSLEDIGIIAEKFLGRLEREGIHSENDIKNRVGKTIRLENNDCILFDKKEHFPPKYLPSTNYIIDYLREGSGIPIEIRINEIADYTQIIVKANRLIWRYIPFSQQDIFGNIPQTKLLNLAGLSIAKQELKELGYLKNK